MQQAAWGRAESCSPAHSQRHASVFFRGKQIRKGATGTRASLAAHPSDNNSFISELTKTSDEILTVNTVGGASASFPLEGSFMGEPK